MEIEFSPSQLPAPRANAQIEGATRPPAATASAPPQGIAELQQQLNNLALTRPDKMAALQPAVSSLQYPPDQILDSIANLLAIHLSQ